MEEKEIFLAKKEMRKRFRALRRALPATERMTASSRMTAELSRQYFYQDSNVIMAYASMLEEVQLYDLLRFSLDIGKRVCIPFLRKDGVMEAAELTGLDELVESDLGVLTVRDAETRVVDPAGLGCIVVPGVAFSKEGARLGMGKGFYDRFLKERSPYAYRVALAFDCQLTEEIPMEPHDVYMDSIITESGTFYCKREV